MFHSKRCVTTVCSRRHFDILTVRENTPSQLSLTTSGAGEQNFFRSFPPSSVFMCNTSESDRKFLCIPLHCRLIRVGFATPHLSIPATIEETHGVTLKLRERDPKCESRISRFLPPENQGAGLVCRYAQMLHSYFPVVRVPLLLLVR